MCAYKQITYRYCKEFMIESRVSSDECPNDDNNTSNPPIIRIKVIPASFGLDGFEETVWEAAESMMMKRLADTYTHGQLQHGASMPSPTNQTCQAMITLVVAAPDLFTDPILLDGISPQAEFESDRFRVFSSNLSEKLALVTKGEGAVVLNDDIHFTTYHPLWRMSEPSERRSTISEKQFPYPCVAISMKVGGIEGEL